MAKQKRESFFRGLEKMKQFFSLFVFLVVIIGEQQKIVAKVIQTYTFLSNVPHVGVDHFFIPFLVLNNTVEIEISHLSINSSNNILDWGVNDTQGFRGWGGGNHENAIIGIKASSRSYLTGPILPGIWSVVVGKAKIQDFPGAYSVNITLRDEPTLPPQPERQPYHPSPPLIKGPRWFAGDFHVHSYQSGDARPTLDEIAKFATTQAGLDFVMISDHNTISQLDYIVDAQSRWPQFLFVPGVEWTSYYGHANGIGSTKFVDHKIGLNGVTIEGVQKQFHDEGALLSINHFGTYEGGPKHIPNKCIGCTWDYLFPQEPDAMEIGIQGWDDTGFLWDPQAIDWWDHLCALGFNTVPVGGSDDHKGGNDTWPASTIGTPTTMVFADNLDASSIVKGVREGRTVVKLRNVKDPMIDFVLTNNSQSITATVTGVAKEYGRYEVRLVCNNAVIQKQTVDHEPFVVTRTIQPPSVGRDRWRAEVYIVESGMPVTITNHVYVQF